MKELHNDVFTVVVCGAAGFGTRELGASVSQTLAERGYEVFASVDYPSLIRGGHNLTRITFSREKVYNDHSRIDLVIAFDEKSVDMHLMELAPDALVFSEHFSEAARNTLGERAIPLQMTDITKEMGGLPIMKTSVALGAFCSALDMPFEAGERVLQETFKEKSADLNVALYRRGYEAMAATGLKHHKKLEPGEPNKELLNGSATFADGLVKAKIDFYVAYPMTPASPVLHYFAKKQHEMGMKVVQPESELSVINMALGMSYAGKRVAIGTAGGGFALMQESFSLAGMAELPIVVFIAQRPAPATGVPTYTSQADLRFVVHAGHGEFPRIVIAPGDAEEAYYGGIESMNLAWKYQTPVVMLMDKHLTESVMTGKVSKDDVYVEQGSRSEGGPEYKRYKMTEDGISPIALPGTSNTVVKVTSYEHDEDGIMTEDAEVTRLMQDQRFWKGEMIKREFTEERTVKVYGDRESKKVVVFWGSTKGAVLEAAKYLDRSVKLVQIVWLEPFDTERVKAELHDAEVIVDVEGNHDAQLASLIRERTGIEITQKILRYDGRPFDPIQLAEELEEKIQ